MGAISTRFNQLKKKALRIVCKQCIVYININCTNKQSSVSSIVFTEEQLCVYASWKEDFDINY